MINLILISLLVLIIFTLLNYNSFEFEYNGNYLQNNNFNIYKNNKANLLMLNSLTDNSYSRNYNPDNFKKTIDLLDLPVLIMDDQKKILYSNSTFNRLFLSLFNIIVEENSILNLKSINLNETFSEIFFKLDENNSRIEVERSFELDFVHLSFVFVVKLLDDNTYLIQIKNSNLTNFLDKTEILFNSVSSPVIIERLDKIVFANDSALKFLNLNLKEIQDKPFSSFYKKQENSSIFLLKNKKKGDSNLFFTISQHKINGINYYFIEKTSKNGIDPDQVSNFLSQKKVLGFTSKIVHDLKTPLNIIYSVCQIFERKLDLNSCTPGKEKEYIDIIKSNCFRQLKLINNIVDIDKLDNNLYRQDKYYYRIDKILEQFVESVKKYANVKLIDLSYTSESKDAIAYIDINSFERIIFNLISNSIKFTPNGGNTSVTLQNTDDKILIIVSDNGVGIKEEKIKYLFDKYSDPSKNDVVNSGLGLHIVKSLIELNDGNISVESNYLNGSTFTIEFPLIKDVPDSFNVKDEVEEPSNSTITNFTIEFSDI